MSNEWKRQLKDALKNENHLLEKRYIQEKDLPIYTEIQQKYEMLVGAHYASLINPQDPNDPILKQAIPSADELKQYPEEDLDPIGDKAHQVTPILVHRYHDRALLFPTFRCPMYCRYCFRKETLNQERVKLSQDLPKSLAYLHAHPEIKEVILTGGDPLMLGNDQLFDLCAQLKTIPSIERLRIHSRFPVTLPQRIDEILSKGLAQFKPIYFVTHFNHPREISQDSIRAITYLQSAGIMVLNQSVLLKGVNDQLEVLKDLFEQLLKIQVKPYYLHHPDQTKGTQHFRVSISRGLHLYRQLRGQISGLALPTYVLDIPRGGGKIPLDSDFLKKGDRPFEWYLTSPITGHIHHYIDLGEKYAESNQ
jgi:lysine 2,3-aminomutase